MQGALRLQQHMAGRLNVFDFHEFAHDALLPKLSLAKQAGPIALPINYSVQKSVSDKKLRAVMSVCAEQIVQPTSRPCIPAGINRRLARRAGTGLERGLRPCCKPHGGDFMP